MAEKYLSKLENALSSKRLNHSAGVSRTAVALARTYGADESKALIAGLLHDCARGLPSNLLLHTAEAFGIVVNDVERRDPMLLHAPVGAVIARREYGVDDPDILSAIRRHTTGGATMSLLDNIIFLADYIEPGRTFPGVERLRELAGENLYEALLAAYDQTLQHLVAGGRLIHAATVEGRNALIIKMKKQNE